MQHTINKSFIWGCLINVECVGGLDILLELVKFKKCHYMNSQTKMFRNCQLGMKRWQDLEGDQFHIIMVAKY
jgi:hypothetical protein